MKNLFNKLFFWSMLLSLFASCNMEEYDLDSLSSKDWVVDTSLDAPIGSVDIGLKDVFLHRGSKGLFSTKDSIYDLSMITSEEQIPLPALAVKGTEIEAYDTLKNVDFSDVWGKGKVLDSLESFQLKLSIVNQLPFEGDIEIRFLVEDSVIYTTRPLVRILSIHEEKSLRRAIHVNSSTVFEDSKRMDSPYVSREKVLFSGEDNDKLVKVKHIVFKYILKMPKEMAYVSSDYALSVDLSAFVKARLSLDNKN